jgi:hypothetical protein
VLLKCEVRLPHLCWSVDPLSDIQRKFDASRSRRSSMSPEMTLAAADQLLRRLDLDVDSKLRGYDLVQMKIGDLVSGGQIRTRSIDHLEGNRQPPVPFRSFSDTGKIENSLRYLGIDVEDALALAENTEI